ncbi:MAG: toll/interleukin-1 receptor domain-containing protein [Terrimicrobiaceae bacterium]
MKERLVGVEGLGRPEPVQAIFISYRRDDSLPWAGRLHEHLSRHFGEENVFIDIDAIDPGEDFSDVVRKKVEECAVFVPIIGGNWLACTDKAGHRRLDDPADHLRVEIVTALRQRKLIVPVFVGGAIMPDKRELPDELAPLATKNGLSVDDLHFAEDVRRLIRFLKGTVGAVGSGGTRNHRQSENEPSGTRPAPQKIWHVVRRFVQTQPRTKPTRVRKDESHRAAPEKYLIGKIVNWKRLGIVTLGMVIALLFASIPRGHYSQSFDSPRGSAAMDDREFDRSLDGPYNSANADINIMKLKRLIDANRRYSDPERSSADGWHRNAADVNEIIQKHDEAANGALERINQ